MSEVNNAIVIQTCAKIASELVINLGYQPDNLTEALQDFKYAFDQVYTLVQQEISYAPSKAAPKRGGSGGRNIPIISREDMSSKLQNLKMMHQEPTSGTNVTGNIFESIDKQQESKGFTLKMPPIKGNSPFKAD